MIWVISSKNDVLLVGPEWSAYGATNDAARSAPLVASRIHPDDKAATLALFDDAWQTKRSLTVIFRLRHNDGAYRRMLARGVPSIDPAGDRLGGFLGTTHEIAAADMTESGLGWARQASAVPGAARAAVDTITDHFLIAFTHAEAAGEQKLAAIAKFALDQIFQDLGVDLSARH